MHDSIGMFHCKQCGADLKPVYDRHGYTCLILEDVVVRKAEVTCKCGAVRYFYADPVKKEPVIRDFTI